MISNEMIEKFQKGTKPEHNVTQQEVDEIKVLLFSTLEKTKQDFAENIFFQFIVDACQTKSQMQSTEIMAINIFKLIKTKPNCTFFN